MGVFEIGLDPGGEEKAGPGGKRGKERGAYVRYSMTKGRVDDGIIDGGVESYPRDARGKGS